MDKNEANVVKTFVQIQIVKALPDQTPVMLNEVKVEHGKDCKTKYKLLLLFESCLNWCKHK